MDIRNSMSSCLDDRKLHPFRDQSGLPFFSRIRQYTTEDPAEILDLELASHGILTVYPYYGPWSWMNDDALAFVEDLVSAVYDKFKLSESTSLLPTGNSMGGLSALIYTRYARRTPSACYTLCPVCDLPYHSTERPDLPRTVRFAFSGQPAGIEDGMKHCSPLHQAEMMPDIPYLILHGDSDTKVNIEKHSATFVRRMKELGRNIEYMVVPGGDHGQLTEYAQRCRIIDF